LSSMGWGRGREQRRVENLRIDGDGRDLTNRNNTLPA